MNKFILYALLFLAGASTSAFVLNLSSMDTVNRGGKLIEAPVGVMSTAVSEKVVPTLVKEESVDSSKNTVMAAGEVTPVAVTQSERDRFIDSVKNQLALEKTQVSDFDVLPINEPTTEDDTKYFNYGGDTLAMDERQQALDNLLSGEGFDTDWAQQKQQHFQQLMDGAKLENVVILDSECRATLCKFVINVADKNAEEAMFKQAVGDPSFVINEATGAIFQQPDGNGGSYITYYRVREGFELP